MSVRKRSTARAAIIVLFTFIYWTCVASRSLAESDWDIARVAGFPVFAFNTTTSNSEVVFKYSVTGTNSPDFGSEKFLETSLFLPDCQTRPQRQSIVPHHSIVVNGEYTVELDIVQESVVLSEFYREEANSTARIMFCVRVDYFHFDGTNVNGVNFHETNVSIGIDLIAGFRLRDIDFDRAASEFSSATASLDYPIRANFCNGENKDQPQPALFQGMTLQVCVSMDETVAIGKAYVIDILEMDLHQPSTGVHDNPITKAYSNKLTQKTCNGGICNVKTQLTSRWFEKADPESIDLTGMALLALGSASSREETRMLRLPINFRARRRNLKSNFTELSEPEGRFEMFILRATLQGDAKDRGLGLGLIVSCVAAACLLTCSCSLSVCIALRLRALREKQFKNLAKADKQHACGADHT